MNGGIGTGAVLLVTVAACASAPSAKPAAAREIVMAYDDAHTHGDGGVSERDATRAWSASSYPTASRAAAPALPGRGAGN